MPRRALVLACAALAACGSGQAAAPEAPRGTVGDVGQLPATFPADTVAPTSAETSPLDSTPSTEGASPSTTATVGDDSVGRLVDGNRLLVIGDSILASTSRRYGDEMCARLVPMGWAVEVDAESGQHIEFGPQVLRQRLPAGWDAAVIMLGNNYGGDPQAYADILEGLLDDLAPRPVVLLTVTQFREDRAEVNYVIRSTATRRDNVRVVEWAERTADGPAGGLVAGDGLHLTDDGRREIVAMTSRALGRAPAGSEGQCLPSRYADDSAGPVPGPRAPSRSGSESRTTPTTRPRPPTPRGPAPTQPAPPTTAAPAPTEPPVTEPPATEPPGSEPPAPEPPAAPPASSPTTAAAP
jgi:hypothetical protein